jgi:hypothetical protein
MSSSNGAVSAGFHIVRDFLFCDAAMASSHTTLSGIIRCKGRACSSLTPGARIIAAGSGLLIFSQSRDDRDP